MTGFSSRQVKRLVLGHSSLNVSDDVKFFTALEVQLVVLFLRTCSADWKELWLRVCGIRKCSGPKRAV